MEKIDVTKIMEEIRAEIKERGVSDNDLSFEEVADHVYALEMGDLLASLHILNSSWYIPAYREIKSRDGIIGKCIIFFKKLIRKMMSFYVEPIAEDQSEFNSDVVRMFNMFKDTIADRDKKIVELEAKLDKLTQEDS